MLAHFAALGIRTASLTRHTTAALAWKSALSCQDSRLVVLGSDGLYWVISARDSGKVRKAGFELASYEG